jgi:hypothetical protein
MTEPTHPTEPKTQRKEPGLFDSIGSFPVWMLKIIHFITPDCLIKKTPPEQEPPKK